MRSLIVVGVWCIFLFNQKLEIQLFLLKFYQFKLCNNYMPKYLILSLYKNFINIRMYVKDIEDSKTQGEINSFNFLNLNKIQSFLPKFLITPQQREQFLFAQYDMEKKGKKFGTSQLRLFRIQKKQNELYQVDKNNQTKLLPTPSHLQIQSSQQKYQEEWNSKFSLYPRRIKLNFSQRSQIYIYFKRISACNEMAAYLFYLICKKGKEQAQNSDKNNKLVDSLNFSKNRYQNKLIEYTFQKILNAKKYQIKKKNKQEIFVCFKENLNDKTFVRQFLECWYKKCVKQAKRQNSGNKIQMKLNLQSAFLLTSPICENISLVNSSFTVFINDSVYFSSSLSKKTAQVDESNIKKHENTLYIIDCQQKQYRQKLGVTHKANISDKIYFQLKSKLNQNIEQREDVWRSQKFSVFSLSHCEVENQKFALSLVKVFQKQKKQGKKNQEDFNSSVILRVEINFKKNMKSQKRLKQKPPITFQHRALIQQLILPSNQNDVNIQFQMQYQKIFNDHQQKNSFTNISFNKIQNIFELFKLDGIIQKFYKANPFNQLQKQNNISHKGSFIYEFLLKKSNQLKFYDVQKLVWKFNNPSIRNLLNALKSFDQVPKINFTQPFYQICNRIYSIVNSQIFGNWENSFFEDSSSKAEAISFFAILGIIKSFPSIYIYQKTIEKRSLQNNSLMFVLILKREMRNVYNKILMLQLNIQAIFGIQSTSLLSRYFVNDHQILFKILNFQSEKNRNKKANLFHSMVGIFLALIEEVDKFNFPYLSAQSYLVALQYVSNHIHNPLKFLQNVDKYISISQAYEADQEYLAIMRQLLKISSSQTSVLNQNFGSIARQIYEQFSLGQNISYRNSNTSDIDNQNRKLYLIIDSIQIDQNVDKMLIEVIQHQGQQNYSPKGTFKLYEHEYKRVNPSSLHQFIEIPLEKMQKLKILIHTKNVSLYCDLDLKNHPSSCYFHKLQNLMILRQSVISSRQKDKQFINYQPGVCKNYHISFQFYIKDSSPYEHLENIIPHQYHNTILYSSEIKKYIIEVRKYLKNCRMRETNFNLFYAKLGWYGCHYIVPHQRLLNVIKRNATSTANSQINLQYFKLAYYTNCLFGRAILPKLSQKDSQNNIFSDIIKNQIRKVHDSNFSTSQNCQYNSSKSLIGYTLECFCMDNIQSFFQFYVKLCELPLIQYLLYQPMAFYVLPPITFQTSYVYEFHKNQNNAFNFTINMVSFSSLIQVSELNLNYKKSEIDFLQNQFAQIFQQLQKIGKCGNQIYNYLPEELNFYYPEQNIYVDNFLLILKANIMQRSVQYFYKKLKNDYFRLEEKINEDYKSNTVKINTCHFLILEIQEQQKITNTQIYYLFRYMNETKNSLKLQMRKFMKSQQRYSLKKHNQIKQFKKWAVLQGKHKRIQILCVQSKQSCEKQYIVQEQRTRRIYKITEQSILI